MPPQARRQRDGNAPHFRFCPPPRFFSCPPTEFCWEEEVDVIRRKKVKTYDFGQKNPRISAKTSFFFFFWRSPVFGRKICDFGQKKPSDFGENLCPPDLNFAPPPPISQSWRRPCASGKKDKNSIGQLHF